MKNIIFKTTFVSLALLLFACSDTDTLVDSVFDNTTEGAVLKTIELDKDIPLGDPDAKFSLYAHVLDAENGSLTEEVRVFASFNNLAAGGANDRDEILLKTIPNSQFVQGPETLEVLIEATLGELLNALNLNSGDITGGDRFVIRLALVMKDGRVFSNNNASQSVLGNPFLNSPFLFNANVICPFNNQSLAGEHTFVTTNMYIPGTNPCGGTVTGSVIWGETSSEGSYTTSDFSFGLFESTCWNDGPATSNSARVVWFCSNLNTSGADQYGENWTYEIISVNGPVMVIEFMSTYLTGEGGVTTLTRAGGQDWPAIFQN